MIKGYFIIKVSTNHILTSFSFSFLPSGNWCSNNIILTDSLAIWLYGYVSIQIFCFKYLKFSNPVHILL